jgi:WD40 repeat protein
MNQESSQPNHQLDQLIAALGLNQEQDLELTGKEIADILWLALKRKELSDGSSETDQQQSEGLISERTQESNISPSSSHISSNLPDLPQAGIYPQTSSTNRQTSDSSGTISLQVPDAPSIREPLELARSLRPLARKISSGREIVLDEIATAQRFAAEGVCIPVFKAEPEPWLDLALVVDESKSMLIWRHTIRELKRLLEHYGIFRDVRTWGLVVREEENKQILYIRPGIEETANQQRLASPRELIDPNGRRLVLVVSDCVAAIWRNGSATSVLKEWTQTQPVAIVQMLPEWLWLRTGLAVGASVRLRSLAAGVANQHLLIKELLVWKSLNLDSGIKVPVLTLEPEVATTWSHMIAGKSDAIAPGFVFASEPSNNNRQATISKLKSQNSKKESGEDSKDRVQRFRMTASPMARKLAGLLAAAPVINLPVVRLVQETLLPESRQVHVAEVFLGGLLKPLTNIEADTNPDAVQYEFMEDEIREILLESAPVSDSAEVLDAVSQYVASQLGKSLEEFIALLKTPEQAGEKEGVKPFARITAKILRQLGGSYAGFADELEQNFSLVSSAEEPSQLEPLRVAPWVCYQIINEEVDVTAICFSPDGKFIASGRIDGTIKVWDLDGNLVSQFLQEHKSSINSLAFSPDGQLIVSGSAGGSIRLWNLHKLIRTFDKYIRKENFVAFSPNGHLIASGSADRTVRLWDLGGKQIGESFHGTRSAVSSVAFSPDGELIVSGSAAGNIRLWNLNGKLIKISLGHKSAVSSVAFSPDGQWIVSGSEDNTIQLWDVQGNPVGQPFQGHEDAVNCVAFRPDGQLIFSGSNDKTIRIWNLQGEQLSFLEGHDSAVSAIAFSPDGSTLVSSSSDGTIRLWSDRVYSFETVTVNRRGEIINKESKYARYFIEDLGDGITLKMVAIPGGTFLMGSPEGEGYDNEKPQHEVTIQPFFMGKYPITQAQWRAVAALPRVNCDLEPDPSFFKGDDRPVECVSWFDAVEFCARISKYTGRKYRLPSEAEWEYACRAGTTTPFHFGETLTTELANYDGSTYGEEPEGEARRETTPVVIFPSNAFGVHDMHGNVYEWCVDHWQDNYEGSPQDGSSWIEESIENNNENPKLLRGGSWINNPENCRSASRYWYFPVLSGDSLGFRVVCGVDSPFA